MLIKTSDLTGATLDWAVAKCMNGGELFQCGRVAHQVTLHSIGGNVAPYFMKDSGVIRCVFEPSTNWAQGGPIIDRERITVAATDTQGGREQAWAAYKIDHLFCDDMDHIYQTGPTALIAAMRCFVASRLGDKVDIPKGTDMTTTQYITPMPPGAATIQLPDCKHVLSQELQGGVQHVLRFANNYGASIVRHSNSYGSSEGLWEVAVIVFNFENNDDWDVTYKTSVTADVLGYLDENALRDTLLQIKALDNHVASSA